MLKVAWAESYVLPLPPSHRFPISKYELLPQQLLYEGTLREENFFKPSLLDERWILLTHSEDFWRKLKNLTLAPNEVRKTGFLLSNEIVVRESTVAQGTLDCARFALEYGVAMNIAGGTHHALRNKGEGFF